MRSPRRRRRRASQALQRSHTYQPVFADRLDAMSMHGVRCMLTDREEHVRCDAWPAERKCVSRGWCGMRPVNATRCIAWAAKRLSALLSCLLPARKRVRRTIELIRHLLVPAPGRERSRRFAVGNAPSASWQRTRRRKPTGTANVRNFGTSPFRASDFRDHPERATVPHHGTVGRGGLSRGACGSTRRKRKAVRSSLRCSVRPVPKSWMP